MSPHSAAKDSHMRRIPKRQRAESASNVLYPGRLGRTATWYFAEGAFSETDSTPEKTADRTLWSIGPEPQVPGVKVRNAWKAKETKSSQKKIDQPTLIFISTSAEH